MADTLSKADSRRRFKWLRIVLWVLGVPLLLTLGSWQWQRAEQKQIWLEQLEQAPATTPDVAVSRLSESDWVPVRFDIELLPDKVFLLDNRTWQGRVGYEVVVPARVDEGPYWLASLGWTPAPERRDQLPEVNLQRQWLRVKAVVTRPLESITLSGNRFEPGWPRRIQALDMEQINAALSQPVEPLVLHVQTAVNQQVLPREQIYTGIPPQRHTGYAVQWFGLALALSAWLIWAGISERRRRS
ncbi:SURF1 family protein [Marinobacterium sp. AK62]|uniref:SURF1-like protein n=1 Tax=Marinobacterium alkalitolerans TaxID=1542925 RepID=A0ABS3ZC46_9GAMM|nr:SURF1 family protein [Marinobacterium alkalitolerans]MBP0049239.1 SURF1 family protein [Marinobacterium alkalitolerans]